MSETKKHRKHIGWRTKKEKVADAKIRARLIAAAPELLEACKQVYDLEYRSPWNLLSDREQETADKLEAVIAKAEGRS